ncbi:MAG: hypothetical protein M3Q34_03585 [bacterium]|nr:hypothetical protein [bacterium]
MSETYIPTIKQNILEENEPKFLKDDRFLEFLTTKEVSLAEYKNNFIEMWKLPASLYVGFHNSFSSSFSKEKAEGYLNASRTREPESDQNTLIDLLIKLLATLEPITVGQLLKVFREIKRNPS